ncbi:glyoxalase [Arthrobacter sp. EpRS71]|uniref:VOC family protein n=1 Tax=Arthrobacter sp. EpRS71 TaxID=1743141 RepID=UPI000745F5DD|nr:glyoxalase [Arthrobacter sp. EpRS71]KUM35271.1 glyoxalase [Arthrobacter sp. EpRS71]
MSIPQAPEGYNTVNSFIITEDAPGMISFLTTVFRAQAIPEAHTLDDDGLILHSELKVGDSTVMVAERKPDWPFTPSLLQVYVDDLDATLASAIGLGATVVTAPTDFFGDRLSRVVDPWSNLWWIYQHSGEAPEWVDSATDWGDVSPDNEDASWAAEASPELVYIHDTLLTTMKGLGR